MKAISKKLNHAILNRALGNLFYYMGLLFILLGIYWPENLFYLFYYMGLLVLLLGLYWIWVVHVNNQQAVSLMAQYTELRAKPYITLQENKKIFNQANMADGDTDNIIKKMDGTTVVNNKNGHEYLVNTTLSKDSNSQYQLVAKINDKNAAINKAWLKEHSKA